MERVGSYSLHWALGLVQAAAVNEPRCSLLCHAGGFWLAVHLASVLSARVSAWDQRGNWEAGWQCEGSSSISLSMRAVEKADMLTQLCLYSARFSLDRLNKDWKLLPLIPSNQGRLMMMEFPFCLSCNIIFFFFLYFIYLFILFVLLAWCYFILHQLLAVMLVLWLVFFRLSHKYFEESSSICFIALNCGSSAL